MYLTEQARIEQLRLAILSELRRKRKRVPRTYFVELLQQVLDIDWLIAAKAYRLELEPHLHFLQHRGLILGEPAIVSKHYQWTFKLQQRGKEFLEDHKASALREVIGSQLRAYSYQQHFLYELDWEQRNNPVVHYGGKPLAPATTDSFDEAFDPEQIVDERERVAAVVTQRRGQAQFREKLLEMYEYQCAITGCDAVDALEAAHIVPYKGDKTHHVSNGVILRADLHVLFDLDLLTIDPTSLVIQLASQLMSTTYQELAGTKLREPKGYPISRKALEWRHKEAAKNQNR
jgi:hypothetical protein